MEKSLTLVLAGGGANAGRAGIEGAAYLATQFEYSRQNLWRDFGVRDAVSPSLRPPLTLLLGCYSLRFALRPDHSIRGRDFQFRLSRWRRPGVQTQQEGEESRSTRRCRRREGWVKRRLQWYNERRNP